jgi:hypothetical protein
MYFMYLDLAAVFQDPQLLALVPLDAGPAGEDEVESPRAVVTR